MLQKRIKLWEETRFLIILSIAKVLQIEFCFVKSVEIFNLKIINWSRERWKVCQLKSKLLVRSWEYFDVVNDSYKKLSILARVIKHAEKLMNFISLQYLQTEIAKRLNALIGQLLPFLAAEHQQQVAQAVERAKQVTMPELNAIIGVSS